MKALATAFFFLSAVPLFADDEKAPGTEHIGIRLREWYARMSGTVEAQDSTLGSTRLDLSDDLGLGSPDLTTEVQVFGRIPYFGRLYAGWWRAEDSADTTLNRTITFAGQTFNAATPVHSEFMLDVFYLNYEFPIPTIPIGDLVRMDLGISLGARGFTGEGEIDGAGLNGKKSGTIGLPTLGGHVALEFFTWLRADVEVLGLAASYGDNHAYYLEAYGEVVAKPLSWLFAGLGYKFAAINVEKGGSSGFKVNVDVAGFYLTAGVRF